MQAQREATSVHLCHRDCAQPSAACGKRVQCRGVCCVREYFRSRDSLSPGFFALSSVGLLNRLHSFNSLPLLFFPLMQDEGLHSYQVVTFEAAASNRVLQTHVSFNCSSSFFALMQDVEAVSTAIRLSPLKLQPQTEYCKLMCIMDCSSSFFALLQDVEAVSTAIMLSPLKLQPR